MRLIDADKLWKDTTSTIEECAEFLEIIEKQPTVDAVPVIRCKDCDYYTAEERWCRRLGLCGAFGEDDFCCHGERKKE